MSNKPKVRFSQYVNEWNKAKLQDFVVDMVGGASLTPDDILDEGDYKIIPKKAIQAGGKIVIDDECNYVTKETYERFKANHVDKSHTIVVLRDLVPSGPNIGYIVENDKVDEGILAQGVYGMHLKGINPQFLIQYSNSSQYRSLMQKLKVGSTQVHIRNTVYLDIDIHYPGAEEQQAIADFFGKVDDYIRASETEILRLKELKKGCLQKMFPRDSSKVPEIRFPGFSDDWEQRKVSEITSVAPFKPYLSDIEDGGEYEVIQQGDKPVLGYANGKPFMEYEKTTLFGDHTLSLYKTKSPFFVASDGLKILYSEGMDGYFYYYLLEKYKPESEGYKRHFSILKECECAFPKSSDEQKKIGQYFDSLDNLITLHQRECDKYKELKKGLLQNMFV
ncbi:restriction endonuclease subunit S [Butyrivibrio sp. NC2002]|uniref:restriction endonuclease subunit S n=1 Tax=Butyrivibrio sp. NC2002 TaxID=1410610 RepID=UPI000562CDAE|nr:restriction endonuclease subunit S [Butyrivibrio sp. NC2002]